MYVWTSYMDFVYGLRNNRMYYTKYVRFERYHIVLVSSMILIK